MPNYLAEGEAMLARQRPRKVESHRHISEPKRPKVYDLNLFYHAVEECGIRTDHALEGVKTFGCASMAELRSWIRTHVTEEEDWGIYHYSPYV